MNTQVVYTVLFLAGFWIIIQLSEFLFYTFKVKAEITRKIAHILGSLSSLGFPFIFQSHWYVLFICIVFFLLLLYSKQKGVYNSIDFIQRDSSGSFLLPIAIYLLYFFYETTQDRMSFILPVLILGISDPLAGLVGTGFKHAIKIKVFTLVLQKTYIGSFTFFISTFILTVSTFIFFDFSSSTFLFSGFYIAIALTLVEIFSGRGWDNLTIPLFAFLLLWILKP